MEGYFLVDDGTLFHRHVQVTGANKGIGFGIVKALCSMFEGDVILTARDEGRGKSALKKLEDDGLKAKFHQLDVTDQHTIDRLKQFLQTTYGGLDILVNNAGTGYIVGNLKLSSRQFVETMNVNYYGIIDINKALFPLLRPHARVCNMSSRMGIWAYHACSEAIRTKLSDISITLENLNSVIQEFVQSFHEDQAEKKGFCADAYGMSKLGLQILTRLQQKELEEQGRGNILVNACTPGYVNTDMTQGKGTLTIEEGAVTPIYLCLLPSTDDSPRGAMLADKEIMNWEDPSYANTRPVARDNSGN